jgi:hypothetical protein
VLGEAAPRPVEDLLAPFGLALVGDLRHCGES